MKLLLALLVISLLHINGHVGMDIIGGHEVVPHSRPYMALLALNDECGGALIRRKWILTAAHCNVNRSSNAILGAHRLDNTQGQQIIAIKRGIKHPQYEKAHRINDIQLIELKKNATLDTFVDLLPLPEREQVIKDTTICRAAGWGITENKSPSDVLLEVNLAIVGNKDCKEKYSKIKQPITESMMCAGAPNKQRKADTCAGDSGGPLICDGKYVGLVSFGPLDCGNSKYPGVYTRLTNNYLQWILNIIDG